MLIELLLKHGVGVKKKPQTLLEIDESYFSSDDPKFNSQKNSFDHVHQQHNQIHSGIMRKDVGVDGDAQQASWSGCSS